MRLRTARLELVPCTIEFAEALRQDRARAEDLIGAILPKDWPAPAMAGFLPIYLADLAADPGHLGLGIWVVILAGGRIVIGDAGFTRRPDTDGAVELGYSVLPEFRNSGYATEAASALVAWTLARPDVARVVAECESDNGASIRVLEKTGLRRQGTRGSLLTWSTEPPESRHPGRR